MKHRILQDLRVELTDEFDLNFERKAFFEGRWKPRRNEGRGSLLLVTGFRSISSPFISILKSSEEFSVILKSNISHSNFVHAKLSYFLFECKFTKKQRKLLPLGVEMNPTANMDKVCLSISIAKSPDWEPIL